MDSIIMGVIRTGTGRNVTVQANKERNEAYLTVAADVPDGNSIDAALTVEYLDDTITALKQASDYLTGHTISDLALRNALRRYLKATSAARLVEQLAMLAKDEIIDGASDMPTRHWSAFHGALETALYVAKHLPH